MSRKKERKLILSAVGFTICFILILFLFRNGKEQAQVQIQRIHIDAQQITEDNHTPFIQLHGTTEAKQLATIKAAFDTDVLETRVYEGDTVDKEQILVELNCKEPQLELKKAQAQAKNLAESLAIEQNSLLASQTSLLHEKKLLTLIQQALKRQKALFSKHLGSEASYDKEKERLHQQSLKITQTELQIKNHSARIKLIQSDIEKNQYQQGLLEQDVSYCTPRAPFNGIVLKRYINQGDRVSQGATLMTLFDHLNIQIRAQLPKQYVNKLIQAKSNHFELEAYNNSKQAFRIASFNYDSRDVQGSFELLLTPEQKITHPILGHVDNYRLLLPPIPNSFQIPTKAIFGNKRIYKIENDKLKAILIQQKGTAWQPNTHESMTIVQSPELHTGDKILITPLPQARTGLKIQIRHVQTKH